MKNVWPAVFLYKKSVHLRFSKSFVFMKKWSKHPIVDSCQVRRYSQLEQPFFFGTCNTFDVGLSTEYVLLCFAQLFGKKCRKYQNGNFYDFPDTRKDHSRTSLGKYNNNPVAIGGFLRRSSSHRLVEINNGTAWEDFGKFPFVERYIREFTTVTFEGRA